MSVLPSLLIVEDDSVAQRLLAAVAERAGFRVCPALTADEAEALCDRVPVDLIMVDLHLPDGDGLELVARLHARPHLAGVQFLVCSGNASEQTVLAAARLGALQFVRKPVDLMDLQRRLDRARAALPERWERREVTARRLALRGAREYQELMGTARDRVQRLLQLLSADSAPAEAPPPALDGESAAPPPARGALDVAAAQLREVAINLGAVRLVEVFDRLWPAIEAGGTVEPLRVMLGVELAAIDSRLKA